MKSSLSRSFFIEQLERRDLLAAYLVKDINLQPAGAGIQGSIIVDEQIYFSAQTVTHGPELWVSDGSSGSAQMVLDIYPGAVGSYPRDFVEAGGKVYFVATSPGLRQVWVTDGTAEGTRALDGIRPRLGSLTAVGDHVYYLSDASGGVWTSDGTSEGTRPIEHLQDAANRFLKITAFGERFLLISSSMTLISDGTEDGTEILTPFSVGEPVAPDKGFFVQSHRGDLFHTNGSAKGTTLLSEDASRAVVLGNQVVFASGTGLWVSDGTADGTVQLAADVATTSLMQVGDLIISVAVGSPRQLEIWITDGTEVGTQQILSLPIEELPHISRKYMHATRTHVFFPVGDELWASDGTVDGTLALGKFARIRHFVSMSGDRGLFVAPTDTLARELWITDGTRAGTRRLMEVFSAAEGTVPRILGTTSDGSRAYFQANDGRTGGELWVTDGSVEGTQLVADIAAGTYDGFAFPPFADTAEITQLGDEFFFLADDGIAGTELWKTDGTSSGTQLVRDLSGDHLDANIREIVRLKDQLLLHSYDAILWISDGTANGTQILKEFRPLGGRPTLKLLTVIEAEVYFSVEFFATWELWRSDGTTDGTRPIDRFQGSPPRSFRADGEQLVFSAEDSSGAQQFWAVRPGLQPTIIEGFEGVELTDPGALLPTASVRFFAGTNELGSELWRTDQTANGTYQVADLLPGPDSSWPVAITPLGDNAVFWANDETGVRRLWRTDGTFSGTIKLNDELQPNRPGDISLVLLHGRLFFLAQIEGRSMLWTTDGTIAGTQPLKIETEGRVAALSAANGLLYLNTQDPLNGFWQLWQSDGTEIGTRRVLRADGTPAQFQSNATVVGEGDRTFFAARDLSHGMELWEIVADSLDGDLNDDARVDFADFLILSTNFGSVAAESGDIDRDGKVDFSDFVILSHNFGRVQHRGPGA